MNSDWSNVVVVVAVLAPIAALVPAFTLPADTERCGRVGCALAALSWAVLLVAGTHAHIGRFAPDDLALAAALGAALLGVRGAGASTAAVTAVTAGLAVGTTAAPSTVAPLVGAAAVAVLAALAGRTAPIASTATGASIAVAAAGVHIGGHGGAAAALAALAVAAVAAGSSPRSPLVVVVPAAFVEALRVGPDLAGSDAARWTAAGIALGVLAVAVVRALPAVGVDLPRRASPDLPRVAVLLPWVMVAASGPFPGADGAGRALAAGAVLALVAGGVAVLAALLPGAVLLVDAVAGGSGPARFVLAAAAAGTLAALARRDPSESPHAGPAWDLGAMPAVLIAAWLVVRPTSWAWLRAADLRAYTDGVAIAAASAVATGVALVAGGAAGPGPAALESLFGRADAPVSASARVRRAAALAAAATGILTVALVRSARL